jgi:sulfur carrier protein
VSEELSVVVNGQARRVPARLSIRDLVEHVGLGAGPVAVEVNGEVVPRRLHGETPVEDGDAIEIVHFVGGG